MSSVPTPSPLEPVDLGQTLRRLRRHADLSQRELAERAGIPQSTVARIESATAVNPGFRTVERLVAATGRRLTATLAAETGQGGTRDSQPEISAAPAIPYADELRDEGGRRYPAHLDVRRVVEAADWWGAWWANCYELPRKLWPREAPEHTYDLKRARRDRRRRRAMAGRLAVERAPLGAAALEGWQWLVRDELGGVIGRLVGRVRQPYPGDPLELVVTRVEVVPEWQGYGLGRRLVATMRGDLVAAGVSAARVLLDSPLSQPARFFTRCGFAEDVAPVALRLPAQAPRQLGPWR